MPTPPRRRSPPRGDRPESPLRRPRWIETAVCGHFGELLQGRLGPDGPLALVTLPAPHLRVAARLHPGPFDVHWSDGGCALRRRQAAALCREIAGGPPQGRLLLRADMPAGGGAGSSTAALLAAAAAYAAMSGTALPPPPQLARLCLGLEGASDPLMYPDPARRLWAPRLGRELAALPALPPLDLVGGFLGPGERTDAADLDFADIADLAEAWPRAAARGDLPALAALASESARRNACRRGGPPLDPLLALVARCGALGIVAAHTGSARGLIFAPRAEGAAQAVAALRAMDLRHVRQVRLSSATVRARSPAGH